MSAWVEERSAVDMPLHKFAFPKIVTTGAGGFAFTLTLMGAELKATPPVVIFTE
jgi:hypothetical protein